MPNFEERLYALLRAALEEDTGDGDHSTLAVIEADAMGAAELKIKEPGILAGILIAQKIFELVEPAVRFKSFCEDGQWVLPGQIVFEMEASVHAILRCERLTLNCMQRMSGIATLTRQFVEKVKDLPVKLLDTRKTTPNFRLLEKEAVRIGGGENHRFGLFDMIMLKDNHIDYCGGLEKAIERAWRYAQENKPGLKIEVETRNLEEVRRVVATGKIDRIMLDNFSPAQIKSALEIIEERFETEASGGIHMDNVRAYAETGVNFISIGGLIHQAKSLDMSMKAVIGKL